jgi:hypothetical protein
MLLIVRTACYIHIGRLQHQALSAIISVICVSKRKNIISRGFRRLTQKKSDTFNMILLMVFLVFCFNFF